MTRRITLCGILAAVSIAVSALERFVPVQAVVPLPGIKLGIANCIVLFALIKLDFKSAFSIVICKCLIVSLLFTGLSSFIYSFTGGILSLVGMFLLLRAKRLFSVFGISVAGSALFNIGQILAAVLMLGNIYILNYLPFLLVASVFTGLIVGAVTFLLLKNLHIRWL